MFKILFRKFSTGQRSTLLCLNVVKFVRREIGEIVRYIPHKKKFQLPLKLSLPHGSHPKSARAIPNNVFSSQCFRFHPNQFTFGGVIAERVMAVFCSIRYFHDRLFEPIIMIVHNDCSNGT